MHAQSQSDLTALRTAIPYIRTYKGSVFVVKIGGKLCRPGRALDHLIEQLSFLYQLGIRIVVVHGGGPQADALGERLGVKRDVFAGRRVTDDATLEVVKMAFAGTANTDLVAAFRKHAVPAIGLSGVDGELLNARRRPPTEITDPSTRTTRTVDFGHVGDILDVNANIVRHLLAAQTVPVICSLAADDQGHVLNVNADTVAAHIALALEAQKYFLLTDVDGVMRDRADQTSLVSYLDLAELEQLVASGAVSGGMLPKLAACQQVLKGGVPKVHIINGTGQDALLAEVFTNEGCGTLLVAHREARTEAAKPATA